MTTAPPGFHVPMVDISPYVDGGADEARSRVARELDEACSTVGFIQVVGHGIPSELTAGLAGAIDDFFALPLDVKKSYRVAGANRGYSPPKSESLSLSLGVESAGRMNDFFEAFNVGIEARSFPDLELSEADYGINVWPELPGAGTAGFRERIDAYFAEASRVARTLTRVFADALGQPSDFFDRLTDHSVDVLRMVNYALEEGPVTLDGELRGMGEHTDFGLVTVLWADRVAGLQVLGADGVWHDVQPVEGGLLVNLGDLTARLTNDRWMSTLHRVTPPIVEGTVVRRRSAAFFHDGNIDAVIETLPDFVGADGDAYEPITVRENIAAKLAGSRHGRANTAAAREAARVLAAASPTRAR
ncbi:MULTISPECIES: isopenicillin N synthase family dioxygenase [Dietzia]|uniref:isopenicillin N synthase family dioxygenase n=1 Tax=Dietzia TaxID=37914 RepID=UPI000D08CF9B|nr:MULTISPECIES: 2-oxoglutarate and iron-dependent oxygenase domain-containing protein [Dietzia]PWD95294.1 isopenicillin N synthase family oxygenase [Dietzia maris]AVM63518.1 2OG-Fe(II) oxygenase [Dietzia sp. oral taxon 368]MBM7230973.1 isopenicillin N synthase family oxygenase [Dietzia cinnamea]MCT1711166.1 isopenicillin N synthase family oxygenase [Dietzia cinnamea]MCT2263242.1 isopenicillin N synthase family oxygenase [Dietzia cinnamea]